MIRFALPCAVFLVAVAATQPQAADKIPDPPRSFAVCYNPRVPANDLKDYDLIVEDYSFPPASVRALKQQKKTVLGYLSLGKVGRVRPFVPQMQKLKIGLTPDAVFPDSFRIDVANKEWHKLVTGTLVKNITDAGFDGVFLDDLDDIRVRRLENEAVELIAAIRKAHPKVKLMANRGLEFLPDFAEHVDYVLLESCFALQGKIRPPSDPEWALGKLEAGLKANPKLIACAVDYFADSRTKPLTKDQEELIGKIRELHADNKLLSCVTTSNLQSPPPR